MHKCELDELFWAMSCLRDQSISSVKFETDCTDLVKMVELWTGLPLDQNYSISKIFGINLTLFL